MTCEVCGSNRMLEGPAYDRGASQCLDCGSQFNRESTTPVEPEEIRSQLPEMPEGGFSTVEEAQAHLAKLKEAASRLGRSKTEDKPARKKKVHPTSDYPAELVMGEYHFYQRKEEAFQSVLSTAKGEREFKNSNILIFAHGHNSGKECTASCREIITNE